MKHQDLVIVPIVSALVIGLCGCGLLLAQEDIVISIESHKGDRILTKIVKDGADRLNAKPVTNQDLPQLLERARTTEESGFLRLARSSILVDKTSECQVVFQTCTDSISGDFATWTSGGVPMRDGFKQCCMDTDNYAEATCDDLTTVAFEGVSNEGAVLLDVTFCTSLQNLVEAHFQHQQSLGNSLLQQSLLQTTDGPSFDKIVVNELAWHLEPVYEAVGAKHSVLVANTPNGSYRLERMGPFDLQVVPSSESRGSVIAKVGIDGLAAGTTLWSLMKAFPGGSSGWHLASRNCHQSAEVAFRHATLDAETPMVPHRWWQEKVGQVMPASVHTKIQEHFAGA